MDELDGILDYMLNDLAYTEEDDDIELIVDKHQVNEDIALEDGTVKLDTVTVEPLIKKFAFLSRNRQLEDQLIKIYCINNTVFAFADSVRYFYSTMIENVSMCTDAFTFNIPYKQFVVIIKSALKSKSNITIKASEHLDISTNKATWRIPSIDSRFDLDIVLRYYGITEYTDTINKENTLDTLKMYLPFVSLSDDSLCINNGSIFCRSNHFYIWSDISLKDNYILNKDNIKLLLTLRDSMTESMRLLNSDDKLIVNCGNEIIAFDRVYDEQILLKEITDLRRKQGVALYKASLIDALNEIDLYTTRNLTITFAPGEVKLTNRTENVGIAETTVSVNSDLLDVSEVENYNISFNVLVECVKCIKEDIMEIVTLNKSEYIQFRTPTINCILMVNY